MEIKVTERKEKTVQIDPPCYVKWHDVYYFVDENERTTKVDNFGFSDSIGSSTMVSAFGNDGWEFITKEEFYKVYNRVLSALLKRNPDNHVSELCNTIIEQAGDNPSLINQSLVIGAKKVVGDV